MSRTGGSRYRRNRAKLLRTADTCAICGRPLFPDAVWPDPYSTTADHIKAIADGGRNNGPLQAAHLRCNILRNRVTNTRHGREW